VETVRTPEGPRQRTLCYLGDLNTSAQARWQKTIEVFNEQGESRQLKLFPSEVEPPDNDPNVARVLLNKVRLERGRQFGQCFLALELWRRLGLDKFWKGCWTARQRMCPGRGCGGAGNQPAVRAGQRVGDRGTLVSDDGVGRSAGHPGGKPERHAAVSVLGSGDSVQDETGAASARALRRAVWAEFDVLLYDLTSSYVEGAGEKDPMLRRGYSRDHRPDCKQVVIALIVNGEGFPLSYETFDGNRADVSTLEAVMGMVERKYGRARRVWVFDRGIVSEENLGALRQRNGQYLVGTPRSKLKQFETELLGDGWERVRDDVEVKRVAMPGGEETYVLCRTTARREKEKAIRSRFSTRMETALQQLAQRVAAGKLKDRGKIERRLGRIEARYPSVADLYQCNSWKPRAD